MDKKSQKNKNVLKDNKQVEQQNIPHNTKKESLGQNTKR